MAADEAIAFFEFSQFGPKIQVGGVHSLQRL